jgi:hypothetical protein
MTPSSSQADAATLLFQSTRKGLGIFSHQLTLSTYWLWITIKHPEQSALRMCPHLLAIRDKIREGDKYQEFRQLLEAGGNVTSQNASLGLEKTVRTILEEEVILAANAVCTTPHLSSNGIYYRFNKKLAQGVVLDEAGAHNTVGYSSGLGS